MKENLSEPRGRYSRGYLPHFDGGAVAQFITWRLADSVPEFLVRKWREELAGVPESTRKLEMYRRVEIHLDEGHGGCLLKNPAAARAVQEVLLALQGDLYDLHEWTVMPNHVHILVTPSETISLGKMVQGIKGRSSREVNQAIDRSGRLWQPDYFDRYVRSAEHFLGIGKYIRRNPVKAGLCEDEALWPCGSACPKARERILMQRGWEYGLKSALQLD